MTAPRTLAACEGKVAFATWADAERAAKRRRRNSDKAFDVAPYRCRVCGKVHVGSGHGVRGQAKLAKFVRELRKASR